VSLEAEAMLSLADAERERDRYKAALELILCMPLYLGRDFAIATARDALNPKETP
jgi:hypothetical protein